MTASDRRFGGLSGLAIDGGRFLAVTDRGAVLRFDPPSHPRPSAQLSDLRVGPGPWGPKYRRDAESIAPDPLGRGWWISYEQRHSLWLYDAKFETAGAFVDLDRPDWFNNRGVEALVPQGRGLLALAENGRDVIRIDASGARRLSLAQGPDIAEAALAPDGSAWLLLRHKGVSGINEAIAPLYGNETGYRIGPSLPVPKAAFDNYEGMAIQAAPGGGLRFWLVTDDGHRIFARTLLVALDLPAAIRQDARQTPGG